MGSKRWNKKVDANQAEIVQALRVAGCSVLIMNGELDLLVGCHGANYILEVKRPECKKKLTKKQQELLKTWNGVIHIVTSPEEALKAVGKMS